MCKLIQNRIVKIFVAVNLIIWFYLLVSSLLYSWKNVELMDEHVYISKDSIIGNLVGITFVIAILTLINYKKDLLKRINTRILAFVLGITAVFISLYWVMNSGTEPQSDARAVCEAASQINVGDYSELLEGGYVAIYPQQLGLITLMRVLFTVFGDGNYFSYQVLSALSVFFIVYGTYDVASLLSKHNRFIEGISLALSFTCLPMYMYTAFVYGEILSIALVVISIDVYLRIYKSFSFGKIVALIIAIESAILVRKNSVIIVIAMLGIAVFNLFLKEKRKCSIAVIIALVLGLLLQSGLMKALYDKHWGEDVEHLPATLWIAMGTNDDYEYAGWYNGLGTNIFWDNELEAEPSRAQAEDIIKGFAGICINNPVYGLDFFNRKLGAQWNAPMYQGLVMNNNITGEQSALVDAIFHDEKVWDFMDASMNLYQLMVYMGVFALLIHLLRNEKELQYYIGLVAVFGGFLFSIMWEAKTRYIFPYLIILLPYAANGINIIVNNCYRVLEARVSLMREGE